MKAEHLKGWLAAAMKEEQPDRSKWDALVTFVDHIWQTGDFPTALPWAILVVLPKPDGGTRGIGLWK